MTGCDEVGPALYRLASHEAIPEEEATEVIRHLRVCDDCKIVYAKRLSEVCPLCARLFKARPARLREPRRIRRVALDLFTYARRS
ncbi:MAG: hypothetical protein V1821_03520 [bacterium]